ncbi:aminotransferase class IV [Arhodomonas sp. SL1]|uniref:aminotransferase class IV n=1 Tax=Arhodomonas sp. SL1 TaxID=3425691 RepID=UPI003F88508B
MDRGFLFGDGVYEVIPVYAGRPFLLDRHLARLADSLAAIGIEACALDASAIVDGLLEGVDADAAVYLQVTRGAAPRRDHRFPEGGSPGVFAYLAPLSPPPGDDGGVDVVLRDDFRWGRCDIKSTSLLGNVLLRQAAEEAGAAEVLLLREGRVTEASASNVFAVIDGVVTTPPLGPELLAGVTRGLILELARGEGMAVAERPLPREALDDAEELWLTSSTRELLPVARVDGRPVGAGRPGPLWQRLRAALDRRKAAFVAGGNAVEGV